MPASFEDNATRRAWADALRKADAGQGPGRLSPVRAWIERAQFDRLDDMPATQIGRALVNADSVLLDVLRERLELEVGRIAAAEAVPGEAARWLDRARRQHHEALLRLVNVAQAHAREGGAAPATVGLEKLLDVRAAQLAVARAHVAYRELPAANDAAAALRQRSLREETAVRLDRLTQRLERQGLMRLYRAALAALEPLQLPPGMRPRSDADLLPLMRGWLRECTVLHLSSRLLQCYPQDEALGHELAELELDLLDVARRVAVRDTFFVVFPVLAEAAEHVGRLAAAQGAGALTPAGEDGALLAAWRTLHQALAEALRRYAATLAAGVHAALKPAPPPSPRFEPPSPGEAEDVAPEVREALDHMHAQLVLADGYFADKERLLQKVLALYQGAREMSEPLRALWPYALRLAAELKWRADEHDPALDAASAARPAQALAAYGAAARGAMEDKREAAVRNLLEGAVEQRLGLRAL